MKPGYGEIIRRCAVEHGLNPRLIAAIAYTESGGNPYAMRYEPAFRAKYLRGKTSKTIGGYVPHGCTFDTEVTARSTSWGLMQVMGQVAREHGFRGEFLSELCDPHVNLSLGSMLLANYIQVRGLNTREALLRWNGGGNEKYPEVVFTHLDGIDIDFLLA